MISNPNSPVPFIFVHANKTGGNAINNALSDYGYKYPNDSGFTHEDINFPHSQHWTLEELSMVTNIHNYYTFSISRNPWDRVVSYFRKNVCNPISPAYVNAEFNDWIKMAFVDKITPEYKTRIDKRYSHKGSQYSKEHNGVRNINECFYYIKDKNNKIGVDFVIEFSRLNEGFDTVLKNIELYSRVSITEVPQMRSNKRTHQGKFYEISSYHDMYNNESVDIVRNSFINDVTLFNYQYE